MLHAGFAGAALALAAATSPACAQPVAELAASGAPMVLEVDRATSIELPSPAKSVYVANPAIADVQVGDPRRVVVIGRKPGGTTVHVVRADGAVSAYAVNVVRPLRPALEAVRSRAPKADLRVAPAPRGMSVSGQVATPREAAAVKKAASQFLGENEKLDFDVDVTGEDQVNLQVRIVEVSRQVSRTLGFSWAALGNHGSTILGLATGRDFLGTTGPLAPLTRSSALNPANTVLFGYHNPAGTVNVNGVLDALQAEGMVSILAQPNLTAASGQTASFLAGGEFPVPVAQDQRNSITIEWKKFGVALDFTPVVLDPGRLSIKVRPEVSEISDNGAVVINNIRVPALTVRRAETTVELASGESFAIAGLFQNNISKSVSQFPWLADLPVIGELLRSTSFTHDQSELVIIVTPYIVKPVRQSAALHTPGDGLAFANELEEIVLGRVAHMPADHPHLKGPAGFILEDTP
jgi:pilus assembly protein CpaC